MRLDVQQLEKTYPLGQVKALDGVSFSVAAGEFIALMGPSGCGKSTLLNILGGLDTPDSGNVLLAGKTLLNASDEHLSQIRREEVGFIFQFFNLLQPLTVFENVALPCQLLPAKDRPKGKALTDKVHAALEEVGLVHRAQFYPNQLSGGEMQRTAIARALINQPKLILADEPTGNLDSENGSHILSLLQSLSQQQGYTILMATHSVEAAEFTKRILHFKDGKLLQEECTQRQ